MAHYVPIPKDLNDIKEKFIMGFTKRQVICFGIGLVLGAPVYFLTRASIGMSGAIFAMNISPDRESDITKQPMYSGALNGTSNTTESRRS